MSKNLSFKYSVLRIFWSNSNEILKLKKDKKNKDRNLIIYAWLSLIMNFILTVYHDEQNSKMVMLEGKVDI